MQNLSDIARGVVWTDQTYCDFQVASGHYHSDGWISRNCEIRIYAKIAPVSLRLNFWNPDFAMRYSENTVTVTVQDETYVAARLWLGENFSFIHDFGAQAGKSIKVGIESRAYCAPNAMDRRERGIILTAGSFEFDDAEARRVAKRADGG